MSHLDVLVRLVSLIILAVIWHNWLSNRNLSIWYLALVGVKELPRVLIEPYSQVLSPDALIAHPRVCCPNLVSSEVLGHRADIEDICSCRFLLRVSHHMAGDKDETAAEAEH
jgi:hypothetical protein